MSFYNNGVPMGGAGAGTNNSGFYQPSTQFAFPQGSMSYQGNGQMNDGPGSGAMGVAPDPLPTGILNALSTNCLLYTSRCV